MFSHFMDFLASVWVHSITLLAGCVFTVMLGLLEKYALKRPLSVKAEVGILAGFVFFACFQAWQGEYTAKSLAEQGKTKAEQKFEELTVPKLKATIPSFFIAPVGEHAENTLLTVVVSITNTGAPSIADNFVVKVHRDDRDYTIDFLPPPSGKVVLFSGNSKNSNSAVLEHSDFLPDKAMSNPIPHGGAVVGFMQVVVDGLMFRDADTKETRLSVVFNDVTGTSYEAMTSLGMIHRQIPDLAGIAVQTVTPEAQSQAAARRKARSVH